MSVIDVAEREQALDIFASYAVQAPAGSGKTELLSLRYLKLLAVSERPEEVLAITFTRKAASEMANRIMETLLWASRSESADNLNSDLEKNKYQIARAVLEQNAKQRWNLLEVPSRLKIQTIDSFCNYLSRRLPVLSGFGSTPAITDDAGACYVEAIRETLQLLHSLRADSASAADSAAESIGELMLHLDNNFFRIEKLLLILLKNRDQWLELILALNHSPEEARNLLASNLKRLIESTLSELQAKLLLHEGLLCQCIQYAATNLLATKPEDVLQDLADSSSLPDTEYRNLPLWQRLVKFVLTTTGTPYKTVNVRHGFPAAAKVDKGEKENASLKKASFLALLEELALDEELVALLNYVKLLAPLDTTDQQWQFLNTLTTILPVLLAQLTLSFGRHNIVDHSQISSSALMALGSEEEPTDLALALDYKIKHILVDEFQDTSSLQLQLLKRLTAGWENGDGRSLFIVGDAMQSCYSFRNANVGLFIAARENGIGSISLNSIDLRTNFRSHASVVNWVNRTFQIAFPEQNNISRGAVKYSSSESADRQQLNASVKTSLICYEAEEKELAQLIEAKKIVARISELKAQCPGDSIAILVRSRSHLKSILPLLREANIKWQATDIDSLASLPLIQDLMTLVRVISNFADRLAWLALLRTPWCGLLVSDLYTVANFESDSSIWRNMKQLVKEGGLTDDGQQRLSVLVNVLQYLFEQRGDKSLKQIVSECWELMQGPACCENQLELDCAGAFFTLLGEQEVAGGLIDLKAFESRLQAQHIAGKAAEADEHCVQIMTIHKSKGLEFDHVILPALARGSKADEKSLLLWWERVDNRGQPGLLLATLPATGSKQSSLYELLNYERKQKAMLEKTRLLYIAVTRAKKTASLFATLASKEGEISSPSIVSLLASIWEAIENSDSSEIEYIQASGFTQDFPGFLPNLQDMTETDFPAGLRRRSTVAELDPLLPAPAELSVDQETVDEAQIRVSAELGTLIHRALESYVNSPKEFDLNRNEANLRAGWNRHLQRFSKNTAEIGEEVELALRSVRHCVENRDLNWIFDNQLADSATELEVHCFEFGRLKPYIIDRTFIDKDDVRWIIDYKTSVKPDSQYLEEFVSSQKLEHLEQLKTYQRLFSEMETRPVKTAILLITIPMLVEIS